MDLRPASVCRECHGRHGASAADDLWQGSMMANSARDPLFLAALTVANQDIPNAGELCIHCHSPRAALFGRAVPPDATAFEPDDLDGVSCDLCHRLVEGDGGTRPIGNGQYTVADDFVRRGPIRDAAAPHETAYSDYHESSELCGLCHEVSNVFRDGFPIERTYSEWLASAYPEEGTSCMTCHLPSEAGQACGARGVPERVIHRHELAGGNVWMPLVLASEHPELGREEAYLRASEAARRQLESAAAISVLAPSSVQEGDELSFSVRVENRTGHKLPTGYGEGKQCWLEVVVEDAAGRVLLRSGGYDDTTGSRVSRLDDPWLRTYEVRTSAQGVEGFHFVLQDGTVEDSRIPPRGFVPSEDTAPVGRDYPVQPDGALAHWDEAPYRARAPVRATGPLSVRVSLWYQTASRDYVEFLRDENRTDDRGAHMFDLWESNGRSPPIRMATSSATVEVVSRPNEGCSIASTPASRGEWRWWAALAMLGSWVRRRRAPVEEEKR